MPNFRHPILPETHEGSLCKSRVCTAQVERAADIKRIRKLSQRAQREATGYFCGYNFKKQPVGRRFLKAAAESLSYLTTDMQEKSAAQQWHRISHLKR